MMQHPDLEPKGIAIKDCPKDIPISNPRPEGPTVVGYYLLDRPKDDLSY